MHTQPWYRPTGFRGSSLYRAGTFYKSIENERDGGVEREKHCTLDLGTFYKSIENERDGGVEREKHCTLDFTTSSSCADDYRHIFHFPPLGIFGSLFAQGCLFFVFSVLLPIVAFFLPLFHYLVALF